MVVLDGATNAVIATVAVGHFGFFPIISAFCYNPTDNKIYCAIQGSEEAIPDSAVSVIDGATNEVIVTARVGCNPGALCYSSANNKVYCANTGDPLYSPDRTVSVIDGATNDVITTLEVGPTPMDLAYSPTQNRVYVANAQGSSISVLSDSAGGVEEDFKPPAVSARPAPTAVRGVLDLQPAIYSLQSEIVLLDVGGRRVLDLHLGANDMRTLAPGVYFVREAQAQAQAQAQAVRKVIVAK